MKALFVTTALRRGGAEQQWKTLLPALHRRGYGVRLLTLQHRGPLFDEIVATGVPASCVDLKGRSDVPGVRRALASVGNVDVIVAQGVDALVVAALASRRARARLVVVEHGGSALARRPHRRLLTRAASRRIDRLVVVSPSQLGALRAIGYRTRNVTVIPNGVESTPPSRGRSEVRGELAIPEAAFVVAAVGGLRVPKRPTAFAAALVSPQLEAIGVHGLVVGDGPLRPSVEEAARRADSRVHVLGERHDVSDLLSAADAFCLVSGTEALPMAVIEAMSAGLPVVASAVGGIPDAVVDGETGLLVAPGDDAALVGALERIAREPALARTLGAAGRERYERLFTADAMVAAYAHLLDELGAGR